MMESSRITRGSKELFDLTKLNVDSYRALIIPSFTHDYNKYLVEKLYNISLLRSKIKEFHVKKKILMAIGPSSINLLNKTLDLGTKPLHAYPSL